MVCFLSTAIYAMDSSEKQLPIKKVLSESLAQELLFRGRNNALQFLLEAQNAKRKNTETILTANQENRKFERKL